MTSFPRWMGTVPLTHCSSRYNPGQHVTSWIVYIVYRICEELKERGGREERKHTTAQEIWAALWPGSASTTLELASRARAVPRKCILGVFVGAVVIWCVSVGVGRWFGRDKGWCLWCKGWVVDIVHVMASILDPSWSECTYLGQLRI